MLRRIRTGLAAAAAAFLASVAMWATDSDAGQQGGSILYVDREARTQELEFRAHAWRAQADYFRVVVDYREAGGPAWKDLDENWGWTPRSALAEITQAARYIARDGYIWRFKNPIEPPRRAVRVRFDETCWRISLRKCTDRLKNVWDRRSGQS